MILDPILLNQQSDTESIIIIMHRPNLRHYAIEHQRPYWESFELHRAILSAKYLY
jgi:hypothetical protein